MRTNFEGDAQRRCSLNGARLYLASTLNSFKAEFQSLSKLGTDSKSKTSCDFTFVQGSVA